MKHNEFRKLFDEKIVILDGATGTNLMKSGMPVGVCPEEWILSHRDVMLKLQCDYLLSGTDILYAPTFTCNRIKLAEYGLEDRLFDMNTELAAISRDAVKKCGHGYVAGDITMTGRQLAPVGDMTFEYLIDIYKEQIRALCDGGCDLLVVETMMSLAETRAAVIAAKEVCDLPVMASLTFNEDGRTLFGTDAITAVNVLQSLGADAVGVNCSTGPLNMLSLITDMKKTAHVPVFAKPNAGMPKLSDGISVFDMTPEVFADEMSYLIDAGASMVGGCCGTTPSHIKALAYMAEGKKMPVISDKRYRCISSERSTIKIDIDGPFMVVGERINPTGKKKLQQSLKESDIEPVVSMAEEQEENGASVLDINVGMSGIDEKETMVKVVSRVCEAVNIPLCIDSSSPEVIEAALRIYPGRALINSISLEKIKIEKVMPLAKKYGAMFILLPLSDEGLPKDTEERKRIINEVTALAENAGLTKEDLIVDALVATIGAEKQAALNCLDTIEYCYNLGIPTICGLSNISFGLPERMTVNTAFLTMAISRGLTMAIANPSQAMLMNAIYASDMLLGKTDADVRYIDNVVSLGTAAAATAAKSPASSDMEDHTSVYMDVIKGKKESIIEDVKALLEGTDISAEGIINNELIPAINRVGELFEQKKYFLPQLIAGATAMETAIDYLSPMVPKKNDGGEMPVIVIATVEGDIHDIGKNLVALMLKNYGFNVIDLGKDVPADVIVNTAVSHDAKIIALSALMTTTMVKMKDVVELAKERTEGVKVIIGGAVITQSYADEIGADGYSADAQEAVVLVKSLLNI